MFPYVATDRKVRSFAGSNMTGCFAGTTWQNPHLLSVHRHFSLPPELMLKADHQFQSVIRNFHCCIWHGWCVLIKQIPAAQSWTQLWIWGIISIYSDVKTHFHIFWFTIFPHLRTLPVQLWKRATNHQCLHHSAGRRGTLLSKGWMPELWNHSLEWKVFT